ncbi:hypothetical protein CROQUDRAFT_720169 [Cronartium quercuum f. sp. fusiforme G11]|uniref:Uncharacterized protein n=1 Tax=Cronartium quercuum f. sp. fusiforme G11 TaxID=708437 RepID=A0A9P6THN8_9BASI|nr:hypothetical protein CROQUDRAFT_720169 [Cronartium quercuum f. sp. fusiforme G11]
MSDTASLGLAAIVARVEATQFPSVYPYVFRILIAYIIIYFVILILSVLLIFIPLYRGTEARKKHLWLWRRQFAPGHSYSTPYYIPNGGIAFVISQIFGSILFEVYMILAYRALKSPTFSKRSYQNFWLAIGNAPGFFGFWYSGFGALYTCIFSPSRSSQEGYRMQRYLAHPYIMNTLCIGTPILPMLIALGWGIASIVTARQKRSAYEEVLRDVETKIDPKAALARYSVAGNSFLAQFRWACLFWSIAAIVSVVFYSLTLILFLRLLKKTVDLKNGKTKLIDNDTLRTTVVAVNQNGSGGYNPVYARKLRKGYHLLMWQCGLLMIVSTWYLVDGLILMIKIDAVVDNEGWRSLSVWIVVSSAFLLALALILQSWRMIADKDVPPQNQSQTQSQREPKLSLLRTDTGFTSPFNVV